MLFLIMLIVLACMGIGLAGGVPIPTNSSKRDPNKDKTELIESEENKEDDETKKM